MARKTEKVGPAGNVRRTSPEGLTDTETRRARPVRNTVTSPKTGCTTLLFNLPNPFESGTPGNSGHAFRSPFLPYPVGPPPRLLPMQETAFPHALPCFRPGPFSARRYRTPPPAAGQ